MNAWKRLGAAATILAGLACASTAGAADFDLRISSGLPQIHMWVGHHMDPFADRIEKETNGKVKFTRFYAGELVSIGREYDALKGGIIDVSAPFLAPYQEGLFPLSDVSQLPTLGTNTIKATRAFQKLLDSDVVLKDGKTFYQYEIGDKGLVAWPLGASEAYAISTTGRELKAPGDFKGVPMRAGSALHIMVLENLGVTPVYMPAAQAYEALSRKTIDGIVLSVGDWPSYSMQELLRYTITGVSMGHWESYVALTKATWDKFPEDVKQAWDKVARDMAMKNAEYVAEQDAKTLKLATEKFGARFIDIGELTPEMQAHIAKAAAETWKQWVEKTEAKGHPARATAKLWAQLIVAEGGVLPEGVSAYLGL